MGEVVSFYRLDPFEDEIQSVKDRLTEVFGYSGPHRVIVDDVLNDIRGMYDGLREAFKRYWNTEQYDEAFQVGPFTLGDLITKAGYHPIAAFLVMHDLHLNPREMIPAIERRIKHQENPSPKQRVIEDRCTYAGPPPAKVPHW